MRISDLVRLSRRDGPVTVLRDAAALVVRVGDVVVKAHAPGTDEAALRARLETAAALPGLFLAPIGLERMGGRLITIWPAAETVGPDLADPAHLPWEEGARLLARLHAAPPPAGFPPAGGPARLARAMARLARAEVPPSVTAVITGAYRTLPTEPTGRVRALCHGDWHLGQLVRHRGRWLLIDVDDLGAGDPAWDLARPAAWYAAGLLDPASWERFLSAYLAAGGRAVTPGDPWRELDAPARALIIQQAATAVTARERDGHDPETIDALLSACARIVAATRRVI